MIKYHKIETLYNRDMDGTKKLISGNFRNETVEYLKDNIWVFTHKIDGTNIRVFWDGHKVLFGGRTDDAQISSGLSERLNELFSTSEAEEIFEQTFGEKQVILFGEGYGGKIQKGGNYKPNEDFILFDVFMPDAEGGLWLKREAVEDIAKAFGIEVVSVLLIGTLKDAEEYVKNTEKDPLYNAPLEGVVGRPLHELKDRRGNRVIVKIKRKDYM